ncbi:MAG: hypothetical protein IKX56_08000 [Muribaculaceae bacterium]|nr:hypothetical protein [Muribaculaceae bacterium]
MKRLPLVILVMLVLGAVVPGCGGAHHYDGRLIAADSLLQSDPDSALTLVEAMSRDSLPDEGDRAYRDLLLTQARYRCYVTATSDSDINRALAWFSAHPSDREKLTRAYIYKGAVMEELGHPDSAMRNYKTAEASAAPDDYFNLGYTKMRIATLYCENNESDGKHIHYLEEALSCLLHTKDTTYILKCMNNLGNSYRETKAQEAEAMLNRAISLAATYRDTANLVANIHSLAVLYFENRQYEKAYNTIHPILGFDQEYDDLELYTTLANIYARQGKPDSAELLLSKVDANPIHDLDKMYYLQSRGEIALATGDTLKYLKLNQECERIASELASNDAKVEILNTEHQYDRETKVLDREKKRKTNGKAIAVIVALAAMLGLLIKWRVYRKHHYYDELIKDLEKEVKDNHSSQLVMLNKIEELQIQDTQLRQFIDMHTRLLRQVIDACYHGPKNKMADDIKRIIQYQDNNKDNWAKFYDYIDYQNHDIITATKNNYPQLKEKDLLLIALSAFDYSCVEIAIIMGYHNATSISTIRDRLAKKMGLDCSLMEYIGQFKSDRQPVNCD